MLKKDLNKIRLDIILLSEREKLEKEEKILKNIDDESEIIDGENEQNLARVKESWREKVL